MFSDWRVRVTMDTDKIKDIGKKTSEKAKDAGKDLKKAGKDAKASVDKAGREVIERSTWLSESILII